MDVKQKVVIIGLSFIVIISLIFFNIRSEYYEKYKVTKKELKGLETVTELNSLNNSFKDLRGLSQLDNDENLFIINQNKVRLSLKKLYDENLIKLYQSTLSDKNKLSKKELFERYTQIIKIISEKRIDISDNSHLLLEPNREMYFLMTLAVLDIPKISENIAKMRGIGTFLLGHKQTIQKEELFHLKQNTFLFLETVENIKLYLSKISANSTNELKVLLEIILTDFHSISNFEAHFKNKNITPKIYFINSSKLLKNINTLFIISKDSLYSKLTQREKILNYKLLAGTALYIILILSILAIIYTNYKQVNNDKLLYSKQKKDNDFINQLRDDYSKTLSLKEICHLTLSHLIKRFEAINGSLYIYDEENSKLYLGSTYGIKHSTLEPTLDLHDNTISENILSKKMDIIDIDQNISLGNISTKATKLVTLPLIEFDKSIGTVQVCFDDKFNSVDLDFLNKTISLMASYIHKAQIDDSSSRYLKLIDQNVLISKTDLDGNIIEVSEELCSLSQYVKDDLLGKNHRILRHRDMAREIFKEMWETISQGGVWKGEIKNRKKDGSYYWVYSVITPDCDINGNVIGYTALRHDITDKKKIEEIAITDGLTSLHNRRHFDTIFPQQISIAKREKALLAFVLIDIDHFKQYNDTYGHQEGDTTLKLVAKVLKKTLNRANDYTFRLGGEEFGLVYHIENEQDALDIANQAKINVEELKIAHTGNSASKFVTISSGLYIIETNDNSNVDDIYKKSDDALYHSKQNGRNQVTKV